MGVLSMYLGLTGRVSEPCNAMQEPPEPPRDPTPNPGIFGGISKIFDSASIAGAIGKAAADASEALSSGVERVAEAKAAAAAQIGRVAAAQAQLDGAIQLERTVQEFLTISGESAPPGADASDLAPLLRKRGLHLVKAAASYRDQAEKAMERGKAYRDRAEQAEAEKTVLEALLQERDRALAALAPQWVVPSQGRGLHLVKAARSQQPHTGGGGGGKTFTRTTSTAPSRNDDYKVHLTIETAGTDTVLLAIHLQ